eukprot:471839_1
MCSNIILVAISVVINIISCHAASWDSWVCQNSEGVVRSAVNVPNYCDVVFRVKEQSGYGIVNFGITAPGYGEWTTNNFNGYTRTLDIKSIKGHVNCKIMGIEVKEQSGYGIVDLRLKFEDASFSDWITNNPNGNEKYTTTSSETVRFIQGKEQSGYGIIDLRVFTV